MRKKCKESVISAQQLSPAGTHLTYSFDIFIFSLYITGIGGRTLSIQCVLLICLHGKVYKQWGEKSSGRVCILCGALRGSPSPPPPPPHPHVGESHISCRSGPLPAPGRVPYLVVKCFYLYTPTFIYI